MAYKHGVYVSEVPTSLISPVAVDSAIPVFVGTAPLHLSQTGLEELDKKVNNPILAYQYDEAVNKLGFIRDSKSWGKYTLSQCIYSQFALLAVSPAIFINVLNPRIHKKAAALKNYPVKDGQAILGEDVILDSVIVQTDESGPDAYEIGVDYSLAWDRNGEAVLNVLAGGAIPSASVGLWVKFDVIDSSMVTDYDIIGGFNVTTQSYEGLELVNDIFPKFRLVIGSIVTPKYSQSSAVAAVMYAKSNAVSGVFQAMAIVDIPSDKVSGITDYTDAPEWKNQKNLVYDKQIVCWPKVRLGDDTFDLSVQIAGLMGKVDAEYGGVPVAAFSNRNLQMDSCVLEDGKEVNLNLYTQANYLNGEGITVPVNWIGGWRAWGVQTAAYPANTDIKDSMISVRRMFNWLANTLILTYFQKVDLPMTKRNIETIVDSVNVWLNGLAAREFLVGHPRVDYDEADNPPTDAIAGITRFHIFATPPPSMKEIEFILEFDVAQMATLFA